jgi:predicted membrane GTPase involved in stress response
MTKKVTFATKPKQPTTAVTPDEWVNSGQTQREPITRFTIDIPTELHARIKSQCALRKVKMKEEIQALLEKHFPAS